MDDLNFGVKLDNDQNSGSNPAPKTMKYETMVEEKGEPEPDTKINKGDYDLSQAGHPIACVFTFLFKALAVLVYFPVLIQLLLRLNNLRFVDLSVHSRYNPISS
jgi:hypothetical protein